MSIWNTTMVAKNGVYNRLINVKSRSKNCVFMYSYNYVIYLCFFNF